MKIAVILLGFCVFSVASAYYAKSNSFAADAKFMEKQKAFFHFFQHIHQNEIFGEYYEEARKFNYKDFRANFQKPEYFDDFFKYYEYGMLPMDAVFCINERSHRDQAIALFRMFYYANDWNTFYKFMQWARFHVNKGMFIYAVTTAVFHRKDMAGIVFPAPYEVYPYYFFPADVIQKFQNYKMQGFYGFKKAPSDDNTFTVVLNANYTDEYAHFNDEQKLAYFTEDIGYNSYYYYFHMDYPYWMDGEEFGLKNDRRGEYYFYRYHQFLVRYFLERYSHELGKIPEFSWYKPIRTGYAPFLRYYNGYYFPTRYNYYNFYNEDNYYKVDRIVDYERRVRDLVDRNYYEHSDGSNFEFFKYDAVNDLGNFFQGNYDSKARDYFGGYSTKYIRPLLGSSYRSVYDYNYVPSAFEHYETSARDPIFYQYFKRIFRYYWQWKSKIPSYKYDQIYMKGVKINSVEMEPLVTYFDEFESDVSNAVDVEFFNDKYQKSEFYKFGRYSHYNGKDFVFKVRQYRLNHKPFSFTVNVHSDIYQKAVVLVFVGPRYDEHGHEYNINDNRENFFELEHFFVELNAGENRITRNSRDFSYFVEDRTTYYELYKQVMMYYKDGAKFQLDMSEAHCGFPNRLMLPRGKPGGQPFQFFFMVAPYNPPKTAQYSGYDSTITCGVGSGARFVDTLPFGYPFDRYIDERYWYTPNMYYYNTFIYHKKYYDDKFDDDKFDRNDSKEKYNYYRKNDGDYDRQFDGKYYNKYNN